jgi:hypothetical protein
VYNASTPSQADEGLLARLSHAGVPAITVEEHVLTGGLGTAAAECCARHGWAAPRMMLALPDGFVPDMVIINGDPSGQNAKDLLQWLLNHTHEHSLFMVRGIPPGHQLEPLWDEICECDQVEVTMDLFDYGLAIRLPNFFKQHYVVSF